MALTTWQTSFAAGELSPALYARTDLAKYKVGAASLSNFFVDYRGGASNRQGTRYIDTVSGNGRPRVIPFTYSVDVTYVLLFTDLLVTVYSEGVLVTSLASPYAAADLGALKYTQSADVVTFAHPSYAPTNFTRTSPTTFTFTPLTYGATIDAPTALTGTPGHANWNDAVYSYVVTAVTADGKEESVPSARVDVVSDIPGHADNVYPQIKLKWTPPAQAVAYYNVYKSSYARWINGAVPVNTIFGFLGQAAGASYTDNAITINAPDFSHTPPTAQDPFSPGQVTSVTVSGGGSGYSGLHTIALIFSGGGSDTRKVLPSGYGVIDPVALTVVSVVITNFGKYMTVAPSCTDANGSATYAVALGQVSGTYPFSVTYFQQRRTFGGTTNFPESVVLSQPGEYNNFNTSAISQASDAITLSIASVQNNTIKSMVTAPTGLIVFSAGNAFLVTLSNGSANEPSALPQASSGANDLPPLTINSVNPNTLGTGGNLLYNTARGNTVRDVQFSFYTQSYTGTDRSVLASHLFVNHTLVEWCYSEEPDRLVLAVRDDGALLALTYVPEQEVYAWSSWSTQGLFISICSVVEGQENAVYVVVQRYVNGAWVYFLERLIQVRDCCILDAWYLDSALSLPQNEILANITITGDVTLVGGNVSIATPTVVTAAVALTTTGDGNYTFPPGTTHTDITAIGGGGGGDVWGSPISPKAGGGAAYAKSVNVAVTAGTPYPFHVGAGGVGSGGITVNFGENSWFGNGNISNPACLCLAAASRLVTFGGLATDSKGNVTFDGGGTGVGNSDFPPGVGGGGAAGPFGVGGAGTVNTTGAGGQGDNGHGGAGGVYAGDGQPGGNGANGTEIDGTHGSGGGGSAGHAPGGPTSIRGGNGGLYGGGGGTGPDASFGGVGGSGAQGIILLNYTYTPLSAIASGDIIRVGCGLIQVTSVVAGVVTGTVVYPLTPEFVTGVNVPPLNVASGKWTYLTPTRTVSGLSHLEGMTVNALLDGEVASGLVVSGGAVTLPVAATNIVVGLAYTSQLQTLYIDLETPTGSVQGRRKLISAVNLRLDCTRGIEVGTDFTHLVTMKDLATPSGVPQASFTGDKYIAIRGATNDPYGQVCIQQTNPLPVSVLGIAIEVTPGDTGR